MTCGTLAGKAAEKLHCPQVVGYFVAGLLLGQSAFNIITSDIVAALSPINTVALALIGFLVGAELKMSVIRKYGKQFTSVLLFEALTPAVLVSVCITLVSLALTRDVPRSISFGLILGAICSSTAPAATTDVLQEYRSRGPLTTMVYGVVAMDDAVALILFAVASTIAAPLVGGNSAPLNVQLLLIARNVFGSIALGIIPGALAMAACRIMAGHEGRILSVTLGILLLFTGVCTVLGMDTILCAMSMGFCIVNTPSRLGGAGGSGRASKEAVSLFKLTERFTPPVYVLFFVLVGSNMDVRHMKVQLAALVITYVICRTTGKSIGSSLGARLGKAPDNVRKYMKFCLLSQAGVAIGLSLQAFTLFKDTIGGQILMTVTMTTFIVTLVGPIFVKYGITKAGEAGMDVTEEDIRKRTYVKDLTWGVEKCVSATAQNAPPTVVHETDTLHKILQVFETHHNQTFAVSGAHGTLTGIITLEHLKETLQIGEMADHLLAMDVMDVPSLHCGGNDTLDKVYAVMEESGEEAVPVVDEQMRPQGMVEKFACDHYIHTKMLEMQNKLARMG